MEDIRAASVSGNSYSGTSVTENTAEVGFTRNDGMSDLLTKDGGWQTVVFKTVYSVHSVRYSASWKYAVVALVFPYLVLLGLLLGPQFHWAFEGSWMGGLAWLDITHVEYKLGYSIFQAILFAVAALVLATAISVGLVAYSHSRQRQPWKVVVNVTIFFRALVIELLYVPALVVLFTPLACDVIHAHTEQRPARNKIFGDHECYAGSGMITSLVAYVALPIIMLLALGSSIGDFEPSMISPNILAAPSSHGATGWTVAVSAMVTCIVIWRREGYMVGGVTAILAAKTIFDFFRDQRYYHTHVNAGCVGLLSSLTWAGLITLIMGLVRTPVPGLTVALIVGIFVFFAVGYLVFLRRTQRRHRAWGSVDAEGVGIDGAFDQDALRHLSRPTLVEISTRIARDTDQYGNYDPRKQQLAEIIFKYGMQSFPDSAFLVLQYANFLRIVRKDFSAAMAQILKAAKIPAGFNVRMMMFKVDKDHKATVQDHGLGADGAMDTASFLEFQQALKGTETNHLMALRVTAKFWRLLLRKDITFKAVTDVARQMSTIEHAAVRLFRTLVDRYPNNVKLLRSYGRFMEEVACDPWRAMRLYNEADKIEDLQEERKRDQLLSSAVANGAGDLSEMVDDQTDAVIVINDAGIVQMTNKLLNQTLGYKAGELDGLNVSVIMPPPFAQRHNGYLRNAKSGQHVLLNRLTKVLALRKDKTVLPMDLKVTKISQGNEAALYMGVMHPIEEDDGTGPACRMLTWLTSDGSFVAVNRAFASVTGFNTAALQGQQFQFIAAPGVQWEEQLMEAVEALRSSDAEEDQTDMMGMDGGDENVDAAMGGRATVELQGRMKHKYGREVMRVKCKVRLVGLGDGRLVEVEMELTHPVDGIAVFDLQGKMQYSNYPLAKILGNEEGLLDHRRFTLDKILPSPYAQFHLPLLKQTIMTGDQPAPHVPCFHSHIVTLEAKGHAQVPVRLQWWPQRVGATMAVIVSVHPVPVPRDLAPWGVDGTASLLESSVCMQLVTSREGVIAGAGCGLGFARNALPGDVFGIDAAGLRGHLLSDYMDVFQAMVQNGQLYSKVKPRELLAHTLTSLSKSTSEDAPATFRGSFICASKTGSVPDYVPIRFAVEHLSEAQVNVEELGRQGDVDSGVLGQDGKGGVEGFLVRVWSANWVNAHVGVGRDGTIKTFDRASEVMFGKRSASVMGVPITAILPAGDVVSRIEAKENRIVSEALHGDGSVFKVCVSGGIRSVAGSQEFEILVQGSLEEPANSIEGLKRLEMLVGGGDGAGLEDLAPVQQAPVAAAKAPVKERKKGVGFAAHVKYDDGTKGDARTKSEIERAGDKPLPKEVAMKKESMKEAPGKEAMTKEAAKDADEPADEAGMGMESTNNLNTQLKKAKKYRHLRRLLDNSEVSRFAETVRRRMPLIVFIASACHIILFAVYTSLVLQSKNLVSEVFTAGGATLSAEYVAADIENDQYMWDTDPLHGRATSEWPPIAAEMESSATTLETVTHALYINTKLQHIQSSIRDNLYEMPSIVVERYRDTVPALYYEESMGLLSLSEKWVQDTLLVLRMTRAQSVDLGTDRNFIFVVRNTHFSLVPSLDTMLQGASTSAKTNFKSLQQTALVIAVLQSVLVVPAFVVAVYFNLMPLLNQRRLLFTVFLAIPRHLVVRLSATREDLAADDDARRAAEADEAAFQSKKPSSLLAWTRPERSIEIDRATQRRLAILMTPMVILVGVILGLHMASYVEIRSTIQPLNDMVATESLTSMLAKVRYWANQMTNLKWKTEMLYARGQLTDTINTTQIAWTSLLQGNSTTGLTGSVLKDPKQVQIIQGKGCLRLDKSLCRPPSDPYYDSVSNGLQILMGKYLTNAAEWRHEYDGIYDDPIDYLTYVSPTQEFVWEVGNKELADGLKTLNILQRAKIFNTLTMVVAIEAILLSTAIIITTLYLWLLRPMVKQAEDEVQRVAKLLSQLPSAMNVEGMLAEMLEIHSQDAAAQHESLVVRLWMGLAEMLGRCMMGRRFKLLMELERAHLAQKASAGKAKREKIKEELESRVD